MHLSNTLPHNNRIEIADVLRGFAVMGITLIHLSNGLASIAFRKRPVTF